MSHLFTDFQLKGVTLRNRIAIPPMCQYSSVDGYTNDWHTVHYSSLARGGAGLVIVEATAVSPEGRISPACLGIWNDDHIEGLAKIAAGIKAAGAVPGIQIAHAGRKANANRPWEGDNHISEGDPRYWTTLSPSPVAFGANLTRVPREMTLEDISRAQADFAAAAKRALQAGFEWLELHFAHGYLAQSFFSVHANQRTDQYGGDSRGRGRFLLESLDAVRHVWPEHLPLTARFGVIEFDGRDEETLAEAIDLSRSFKEHGLDFLSVSMGFSTPQANIPWGAAFMGPVSQRVRRETGLPVASAWGFGTPALAEGALAKEQMDLVMVGRAHLQNPHWPFYAASELKEENAASVLPHPYSHWLSRYR
ncbi:MAG: NADH:flavin oxidoreductase/NADH oxidase [Opitutales bacterium]|nr:NADH:flavin oxidoreductase/NADH oxidase [Opitutales bacterium]